MVSKFDYIFHIISLDDFLSDILFSGKYLKVFNKTIFSTFKAESLSLNAHY